jgi:hypothetical protein
MRPISLVWIIVGIVVLAVLVWWVFTMFNAGPAQLNVPENGPVTMEGTIVCLPHRDTSGPQTLECAYGLLGEDDNHYALQGTGVNGSVTQFPTNTEVRVEGNFTREEDERYATVGVIRVESITPIGESAANTVSDGLIEFDQPEDFGLAISQDQILVDATVPPCTNEFSYCLYYNGTAYDNTNFESAGVSVRTRNDLTDENACLTTQPAGYTDLERSTSTGSGFSMALFAPLEDAGTGQFSTGEDYRLFASSTCYQFITRVGETQFASAATGTREFSEAQRMSLLDMLRNIVSGVRLQPNDQQISLPAEIE